MRVFTRDEILTASYSNGLPANQKHVIGVLAWWCDPADGKIHERKSIVEIAAAASLGERTVKRVLADLVQQGWLRRRSPSTVQRLSGQASGYWLSVPEDLRQPESSRSCQPSQAPERL